MNPHNTRIRKEENISKKKVKERGFQGEEGEARACGFVWVGKKGKKLELVGEQ